MICLPFDHLWIDENYAAKSVYDSRKLDRKDFITLPSAELHCFGKKYDQDGVAHRCHGLPTDFVVRMQMSPRQT